jgi:hypothetical protein
MFKVKINPDRHNAIQNLNYGLLPDPPLFSLPSTFNAAIALLLLFRLLLHALFIVEAVAAVANAVVTVTATLADVPYFCRH